MIGPFMMREMDLVYVLSLTFYTLEWLVWLVWRHVELLWFFLLVFFILGCLID